VKSREHVDDLKEELGGDPSWAAAGGMSAAAQSWVQQQHHTKEDGDDQSYQQSGLSVQVLSSSCLSSLPSILSISL
jgi:hypothetical protein